MPTLPRYVLLSIAGTLEVLAQYCRELAATTNTTSNTCGAPNCPRPPTYLGRCDLHSHLPGQRVCLTCFCPSYKGHNSNCPGTIFEQVVAQTPSRQTTYTPSTTTQGSPYL